jgi:type I restriction enzyme R subunit
LINYTKYFEVNEAPAVYQTEAALEKEFIQDLINQGYENPLNLNTPEAMLANVRVQLQSLNNVAFSDGEWTRFVEEYLDKPSDNLVEKTRKIHENYIYDFVFDDGHIQNIYLVDKKNIARNKVQVIKQFEQKGTHANRYDVTILVNGLPLYKLN